MERPAERLIERLDRLIAKGEAVYATRRPTSLLGIERPWVKSALFGEWRAQATHLLVGTLGEAHPYAQRYAADVRESVATDVSLGLGTLRALREDATNGDLVDLRSLLAGEVFSDFLDMAKHLLDQGYPHPAASLAGAVLEDGMRRIADGRTIELKPMDGAGAIAARLRDKNVHTPMEHRQLALAIEVRDNADHGRFDQVGEAEVQEMLRIVEAYLAAHLTAGPD